MPTKFLKFLSVILFSLVLVACANKLSTKPEIKYTDRTTMSFTGKGAAAGMMMDAYLGGTGVAIGIAIDEGIAKDIAANIARTYPDFSPVTLLEKELPAKSKSTLPVKVEIKTYGFRTVAGDGDLVAAWLVVTFTGKSGGEVTINYPQDFNSPKTAELSQVKADAMVAHDLLKRAVSDVVIKWSKL